MSKPNENRIIMDTPDDAGAQLKIQEEIIRNVLGTDIVKERIKRFKLGRDMVSEDKAVRAAVARASAASTRVVVAATACDFWVISSFWA